VSVIQCNLRTTQLAKFGSMFTNSETEFLHATKEALTPSDSVFTHSSSSVANLIEKGNIYTKYRE